MNGYFFVPILLVFKLMYVHTVAWKKQRKQPTHMAHKSAFLIQSAIIKIEQAIRFDQFTNNDICSIIKWSISSDYLNGVETHLEIDN